MRKHILLSAAILAAGATADAAKVSAVRAREIAATVLPAISADAPRRAPGTGVHDDSPYYVFNANGSGGYVIVAGDDRLPAILGYSHEGNLDPENAPEALTFLLEMSTGMIDLAEAEASPLQAGTPVVEPLLGTINWGQSDPFNALCPMVSSSQRGYVGCVATAMSQIMKFYNYPDKGTGTHSYLHGTQTLSADFGATTYDWANMPAEIPANVTDAQRTAYSTLCSHLGIAVDMQYATGGSGAYTMMVSPALRDYFRYSPSIRMHSRSYYNTDEWMSMIRTELDAGRPVYYAASSEDGLGGHAFVCDGYDSEGFVHINWGWFGSSNGYFYINHLNPGELGTGGGGGAYNIQQEIITDFAPAADGDPYLPTIYGSTRFSCDSFGTDMLFMTYLENLDTRPFTGEVLAVLADAEGNIVHTLASATQTVPGFSGGKSGAVLFTMRNVPTAVGSAVPEGTYRLNFAYKTDEMAAPELLRHPIGLPSYANCTVHGGTVIFTSKHEPVPVVKMTTPLTSNGDLYAGGGARFSVTLRNESADFRLSTNVLTLTSVDDPTVSYSKEYYVNVYEQSEADLIMDVDLPADITPGSYTVTLAHKGYTDRPYASHDGEEITLEVLPEAASPVIRFTTMPVWQSNGADPGRYQHGDILLMAMSAKNYGSEGTTQVICRLRDADGRSTVHHASEDNWTRNQASTITLSNYLTVAPGTYTPEFYYLDENGAEKPVALPSAPESITVEANPELALEVTAFDLPSKISKTEKVNYNITVKGLVATSGTLYIRVRQFTNKGGEIVHMRSGVHLTPDGEQTFTFSYKPGVADGRYVVIVEFKEGNTTKPAGGQDIYYRELVIGDLPEAGIDEIAADPAVGTTGWYDLQGRRISEPAAPGLYIRRHNGTSEKVIIK